MYTITITIIIIIERPQIYHCMFHNSLWFLAYCSVQSFHQLQITMTVNKINVVNDVVRLTNLQSLQCEAANNMPIPQ